MGIVYQISLYSVVGLAGILIQEVLPFLFPAPIISMVLLLLLLIGKLVKSESIAPLSNALLSNMGLFFIIPTISIIRYITLLEQHLFSFIAICVIATILTFIASSSAVRFTIYLMKKWGKI